MNTIEALQDYWDKNQDIKQAEIGRQMGVKPRIVNAWIRDGHTPAGGRLILCQEFLLEKGYEIDGLQDLTDSVRELRKKFFKRKIIAKRIQEALDLAKETHVWAFLRGGYSASYREQACLRLLEEMNGQEPDTDSQQGDDFDQEFESALGIIIAFGEKLKSSTPQQRKEIRKKHPGLFDASNIWAAACSEQALRTFIAEQ
jgi:hypothetical protein